jgi:hypothetical protein
MAMVGDLGGVLEIVLLILGIIFYPISEFSFNISAAKRWFVVRTSEQGIGND